MARDESGADPLDRVGPLRPSRQDRRGGRLDGDHLDPGLALLQDVADAGDGAAGADAGHEDVDLAVGVGPDLLGRGPLVDGRIGRVLELLGHEEVAVALGDLGGLGDGPAHAVGAGGQHQLGAVAPQQHPALLAHGLRHGEDALVAAGGAHHGQGDAGVAAGRLHDGGARRQQAGLLGGVDHRDGDAVLDAAGRVEELELGRDPGAGPVGHVPEADERCPADELGDVVRDPHVRSLSPAPVGRRPAP